MNLQLVTYSDWAAATRAPGVLNFVAMQAHEHPRADLFGLFLRGVTGPGSVPLGPAACQAGSPCGEGEFVINFDFRVFQGIPDLAPPEAYFEIESGTVRIESHDGTRVRGTFDAVGVLEHDGAERVEVTITNGQFDLPIVAAPTP